MFQSLNTNERQRYGRCESVLISVKVDLGIAEAVRVIDGILTRWHNRNTEAFADFAPNLADDLESCSQIVKALEGSFHRIDERLFQCKDYRKPRPA